MVTEPVAVSLLQKVSVWPPLAAASVEILPPKSAAIGSDSASTTVSPAPVAMLVAHRSPSGTRTAAMKRARRRCLRVRAETSADFSVGRIPASGQMLGIRMMEGFLREGGGSRAVGPDLSRSTLTRVARKCQRFT